MGESLDRIRFFTTQILSRLSTTQKVVGTVVVVIALAMAIIALVFTSAPPYEPLFSELSPKDASEILDKLREKNIAFRLGDAGKTVLVPSSRVYELRIEFAREGLPETGTVGYELFDKQELGVTEFQQQVTYKRALEGELSRTIRSIEGVEKATVMIVIPKERLFEKDQKPTTASVQLALRRKAMPRPMTIDAISHLVANSVEGLEPENVTITDTRGRILSENRDPNGMLAMSSDQLAFRRKVERDLEQKALAVLEKRVGPGNATVQVNATLNWSQVEKTIQEVDPEKTVTISEETNEQSAPGSDNAGSSNSSNTITNYEASKSVQKIVEGVGNIRQLSVAVMVNHKTESQTDDEGNVQTSFVPRDAGEMQQLEQLAKMAVGFKADRNDQFSIVNMEFETPPVEPEPDGFLNWDNLDDILYKALIAVVLLVALFTVRSILKSAKDKSEVIQLEMKKMIEEEEEKQKKMKALSNAQAAAAALNEGEEEEEEEEDELVMQNEFFKLTKSARNLKQEQLQNYIQQNPEVATKLIKVWLMEEEE